jgi:hypothetical protein
MDKAQKTVEQRVQELHLIRRQAGAVLEHDQRLQCLEHRLARLRGLTQLNQCIFSSLQLDEVLHAITQAAATLMQAPVASLTLRQPWPSVTPVSIVTQRTIDGAS